MKYTSSEIIIDIVKNNVSHRRFEHIIGVANTAKKLALQYGENPELAFQAGLLHDIAKEKNKVWHLQYVQMYYGDEDIYPILNIWHAYTAKYLMIENSITVSKEVIEAIEDHVEGNKEASKLSKILFIADFIEPNRKYNDCILARRVVNYDIEVAYASIVVATYNYLITSKKITTLKSKECFEKYYDRAISLDEL